MSSLHLSSLSGSSELASITVPMDSCSNLPTSFAYVYNTGTTISIYQLHHLAFSNVQHFLHRECLAIARPLAASKPLQVNFHCVQLVNLESRRPLHPLARPLLWSRIGWEQSSKVIFSQAQKHQLITLSVAPKDTSPQTHWFCWKKDICTLLQWLQLTLGIHIQFHQFWPPILAKGMAK